MVRAHDRQLSHRNRTTVASDEIISQEQAARLLGRFGVYWLILLGVLEQGVMTSGIQGVTLESVERETAWLRSSS